MNDPNQQLPTNNNSTSNQLQEQNLNEPLRPESTSQSEIGISSQSTGDDLTQQVSIEINENQPQTISNIRSTMERRLQERTQNWPSLSNVFQEIRPLVEHARINNSNLWARHNNSTGSMAHHQQQQQPPNSSDNNDSFVINLDGHHLAHGNNSAGGFVHVHASQRFSNSLPEFSSSSSASILDGRRPPEINHPPNARIPQFTGAASTSPPHNHAHAHANAQASDDGPMSEAFAQIPEARALLNSLLRYVPYICIILAKTSYDHLDGILDFFALFITFSHANWAVRQEIAKHGQRSAFKLVRELLYIVLVIVVIGFMLEKKNIFVSMIFANTFTYPFTLRSLLFSVGITDLVLKLITVGVKIVITLLPGRILEYKGRGRIFLMAEALSQLYRGLAPIQPWLIYLLEAYNGSEKLLGVAFSAAYMVAKGSDLVQTLIFVRRAFVELLKKVSFGTKPNKEQLQATGGQCPICHDSYTSPVLLECSHIFCELCVGTWFDREQTCPLCRAKVVDDPAWRDGATTMFVQLF